MPEVITTDEFKEWYEGLDDVQNRAVVRVIDLLEDLGVLLPFPYSSLVKGAKYGIREGAMPRASAARVLHV